MLTTCGTKSLTQHQRPRQTVFHIGNQAGFKGALFQTPFDGLQKLR
jgi:hypothetical protein